MRILITNDDGIEAPGLRALEHIAGEVSKDVWVVSGKTVSGDGLDGADGHRTPAPRTLALRTLALRTLALALHKQEEVGHSRRAVAEQHTPFVV